MSSGGRAAAAANSKKVKQRLVNVLFGKDYSKRGREAHKKLDFAAYSYDDLRKAYFEKVQLLHPDKSVNQSLTQDQYVQTISSLDQQKEHTKLPTEPLEGNWRDVQNAMQRHNYKSTNEEFIDLKEAWEDYHRISKVMKKGNNARSVKTDFTMFGVGCSFSDSPAEQKKRSDMMDQACRGWLSAGRIGEGEVDKHQFDSKDLAEQKPVWSTDERGGTRSTGNDYREREEEQKLQGGGLQPSSRKSLIDHLMKKR